MMRAVLFDLDGTLLNTLGEASDRRNATVHYTRSAPIDQAVRSRDAALVVCFALGAMRWGDSSVLANAVVFVLCIALGVMRGDDSTVRAMDVMLVLCFVFCAMMGGARYGACCVV